MSSFAFVTHNHKLLLLLRDNKPTIPNPNTWSLLGGREEADETPEETLFRELKEEANIDKSPVTFLAQENHDQDGVKDGRTRSYYLLKLQDEQIPSLLLGDEGQEIRFFTLDELKKVNLTPRLAKLVNQNPEKLEDLLNR